MNPHLLPLLFGRKGVSLASQVAALFANGEVGVWYDPSDFSTMFQDPAGTTPVTAVEQPVGKILDKSGRGNHASQDTTTSRPTLSARYNLIDHTEDFTNAGWATLGTVTKTVGQVDPNGGTSAVKLVLGTDGTFYFSNLLTTMLATRSVWIKSNTGVGYSMTISNSIVPLVADTSWHKYSVQFDGFAYGIQISCATGADISIAFPQQVQGISSLPYQRVTTATDYDTAGFKPYLAFDGVDDYHTTSAGGGATVAFFYCASILLSQVGVAQTLFSDTGTNTGYRVRINASNQLEFSAGNGTAYTTVNTTATISNGEVAVITCWHDGVNLNAQINNGTVAQTAFATATAGTDAITFGRDNGAATSYFKGGYYADVYVKDVLTAGEITSTKAYCASKAGVTL